MEEHDRKFYCPKCKVPLLKSDMMMDRSRLIRHLSPGDVTYVAATRGSTPCPQCGAAIPVEGLLTGRYDHRHGGLRFALALAVFGLLIFVLVRNFPG